MFKLLSIVSLAIVASHVAGIAVPVETEMEARAALLSNLDGKFKAKGKKFWV